MNPATQTDTWIQQIKEIGPGFARRAEAADSEGKFPMENYNDLKERGFFSAMIPAELGGGGISHARMCDLIRRIAHYCSSTALAFSMHQHLVAANVWKFKHQGEGAEVLRKVAGQQLVLVSTGARDWLGSNGKLQKTDKGYLLSGKKYFASQSVAGDVVVTSAPYQKNGEWKVLHFPVPMKADGVRVLDDWDVMGMRATGSQTVAFDEVFVPEEAIVLERPRDEFHPVWHVVLTVALPLIMAAYVGIAEKALEIALQMSKGNRDRLALQLGQIRNDLLAAQTQWRAMIRLTDQFNFQPAESITQDMVAYKANVAQKAVKVVEGAMEAVGGRSFYRKNKLERLFRDVQAAPFHPMQRLDQLAFAGAYLLDSRAASDRAN